MLLWGYNLTMMVEQPLTEDTMTTNLITVRYEVRVKGETIPTLFESYRSAFDHCSQAVKNGAMDVAMIDRRTGKRII